MHVCMCVFTLWVPVNGRGVSQALKPLKQLGLVETKFDRSLNPCFLTCIGEGLMKLLLSILLNFWPKNFFDE